MEMMDSSEFRGLVLLSVSVKLRARDGARTHGASQRTGRRSLSQLLRLPDFSWSRTKAAPRRVALGQL